MYAVAVAAARRAALAAHVAVAAAGLQAGQEVAVEDMLMANLA